MGYFKVTGGVATPFLQTEDYWFKKDGEDISQEQYCEYQSQIGPDVPPSFDLTTNHPDVCGLKAKRDKEREDNQRKPE
jgi:hypothetical protein|tara:strand:+ start:897 stop:1130 length:234 start_codon:yes stop_codon:yes gene_type:complete